MDRQIKWNWKMEWEILELFYLIAIERNEIVFFFLIIQKLSMLSWVNDLELKTLLMKKN
jgi:hypothetical protein